MRPVLLLPGIRGIAAEFRRLLPHLAGREVLACDLPALEGATTLHDHAAAVLAALPAPSWRPVVVGASFGGLVARCFPVHRHAGLVTIGTLPAPNAAARRCRWTAPLVRRLPQRLYRELYAARARRDWDEDDPGGAAGLPLPSPAVLAARLHAIGAWGVPTVSHVALWGATDRWVDWSAGDAQAVGGTGIVVPGGHRPHLSHPAEVARWVPA